MVISCNLASEGVHGIYSHMGSRKGVGNMAIVVCSSNYSTSLLSIKSTLNDVIFFSTLEFKYSRKIGPLPNFKSVTSVTLGQKWVPKFDILCANAKGSVLYPSFPADKCRLLVNQPSSS
jgi:hypothetical protein